MRSYRAALVIIGMGLLTFGVVFTFLQASRFVAAPELVPAAPTPAPVAVGPAVDSMAIGIVAGQIAVGLPSGGSEPLLQDARRGDRLDVLASLPSPADSRPVTVVVVRGATILRPATATDPLLVSVSSLDAIALAHLVQGGTHLAYTVWPDGGNPPKQPPLDEQTARVLLGLPPLASPVQPTATPEPTLVPTLVPVATPRPASDTGFLYQVQPGDTWDSIAAIFGMSALELQRNNELPATYALVSDMLLFIPRQL